MSDISPPNQLVPGVVPGVPAQTLGVGCQKSSTMIPHHERIYALVLACPFMVSLFEGKYDDLLNQYPQFKQLLSANCCDTKVKASDVHLALLSIYDDIEFFVEMVTEAVARIVNRALNMVKKFIKHAKLRIKYPHSSTSIHLSDAEMDTIKAFAASGTLTKKQVIAMGLSFYETGYTNSGIGQIAFIVDFGKIFNMKITESYARTAITDIRNDYKDGTPPYIKVFFDGITRKMGKLNEKSDEAYDLKVKASRLANKGK